MGHPRNICPRRSRPNPARLETRKTNRPQGPSWGLAVVKGNDAYNNAREDKMSTPKAIDWKVSAVDAIVIKKIAERAHKKLDGRTTEDIEMDVIATHNSGCPLRLVDLLAADDANFGHDMRGIRENVDHKTGELRNHFMPRYAVGEEE